MQRYAPWIILLVLIAALGGTLFWYFAGTAVPAYTPPAAEPPGKGVVGNASRDTDPFDVVITYSADGFSPRDITVAQGTRVRFLNASEESTWPASGIHPTHTLYPEKESTDCLGSSFDSCAALKPGEFYDFTFYYTGTWTFHDHLHAYNTGSLTVTASSTEER